MGGYWAFLVRLSNTPDYKNTHCHGRLRIHEQSCAILTLKHYTISLMHTVSVLSQNLSQARGNRLLVSSRGQCRTLLGSCQRLKRCPFSGQRNSLNNGVHHTPVHPAVCRSRNYSCEVMQRLSTGPEPARTVTCASSVSTMIGVIALKSIKIKSFIVLNYVFCYLITP